MSEFGPPPPHTADPSLVLGNTTPVNPELQQTVGNVIEYFNQEFQLDLSPDGTLQTDPTTEQLTRLHDWHTETSTGGIDMPDRDTFTAKTLLARALMPQRREDGTIMYLFGKGVGAELALQGEVEGRTKRLTDVPYRTHSDFEIYGAAADNYDDIPHSERFRAVFGGQEIFAATKTKGLRDLPPDYLHKTAETATYGGLDFLVPRLEIQLVDKFEKTNETMERKLRGKTDVEWLAAIYNMDAGLVHSTIDKHVIAPALAELPDPAATAEDNTAILARKLAAAKRRLAEDMPQATDQELGVAARDDFIFSQDSRKRGVADVTALIDSATGQLVGNATELLRASEKQKQDQQKARLDAKHAQIDALLQAAPP